MTKQSDGCSRRGFIGAAFLAGVEVVRSKFARGERLPSPAKDWEKPLPIDVEDDWETSTESSSSETSSTPVRDWCPIDPRWVET